MVPSKSGVMWLTMAALVMLACGGSVRAVAADRAPSEIPAHAHPKQFGDEWECDRGYIREGDACAELQVPAHAYLDAFGRAWLSAARRSVHGHRCAEACLPNRIVVRSHLGM